MVEHQRDKPRTWVQIVASVMFFLCSFAFFLSFFHCYPGEALEGPILTGIFKELNNVDSNNDIKYERLLYYDQLWTFIEKNVFNKNMSIKSPHEEKRAAE